MMNVLVKLLMWSVLILQSLPGNVASNSCTFQEGGCTYNIHLTYKEANDTDRHHQKCGTKEQQIFLERAQNDYAAKIDDMEKNFSFLRDAHEQRIKELESTVKEMRHPDKSGALHPGEVVREVVNRTARMIFSNDLLMRRMEEELNKLRGELKVKSEELAETINKLNETTNMVHEAQLLHFKVSQDFLNAENEITLLKRERAVLKNQLKDRTYRLEVSTQIANECEAKSTTLQEQLAELFRSENTLKEDLMTVHLRLNKSRDSHKALEERHVSLKTRHDNMKINVKMLETEIMDCYMAKTSVFCDFEDPKMCGFTNVNDSTDFFNWERAKGQTPTPGTGPSKDHTCAGPNGHFMFIEASSKGRGNNAIIFSPLYRGLSEQCVEFFYHMNGKHIGTLNVYAQAQGDILRSAWRAFGNQGDVWTNARLSIPKELAQAGYQIAFEGITEIGYLGDISIDDVSVSDGPCPVDGRHAVHVEVNNTVIAKNIQDFTAKIRKRQKQMAPR